jgi:hypothetical protein
MVYYCSENNLAEVTEVFRPLCEDERKNSEIQSECVNI